LDEEIADMSGLLKRFRPKEADQIDGLDPSPQQSPTASVQPPEKTEKDVALSSGRDVEEAERNRRLAIFERAHRWDANLDDDQLHDIDDVINARDPNSEARVYEEVFENSPYPEVQYTKHSYQIYTIIYFLLQLLTFLRFEQLSGIMTRNFLVTPSGRGLLGCC
jgi:hypothetical protein